jgi:N-acyl-D-aspartate/D-glutamate deacylase
LLWNVAGIYHPLGMRILCLIVTLFLLIGYSHAEQEFDLVIQGGRVMDPETGFDGIRNVGITNSKIVRISGTPLTGKRMLSANGLVVAPGFIDLHQHGQDLDSQRLKAFDGVTTALEMEIGKPDVAAFLQSHASHSLINYGTTASHVAARSLAFGAPLPDLLPKSGSATDQPATSEQIARMKERLLHELDQGALGVGMGIAYTPGATRSEIIQMFSVAAERGVPVFTHVRSSGRIEPGSSVEAVSEVIAASAITGASLQIVHVNSSCMHDAPECLAMIAGARARGLDVTAEAYPYIAGMTYINSAVFNPGWQQRIGITYDSLQLPGTGERLTQQRFEELHNSNQPQLVLIFQNTQAAVDAVITNPLVMIASDGLISHPRNAGTFSRILRQYVREQRSLTLMDALRKMTLMPSQRLERSTPNARKKGRMQEGADADIVVFDPQTITDRATFQHPTEQSTGVHYLIVNGTLLIDQGKLVTNQFPGQPLLGSEKH